ncbi:hypothetical protein AVEN_220428-1 [Araneus ventricosus]|uniref:Uncharacterized protein n=1 Tax=Araneus ventricosus TaxID=182803 RepID=A0A4Y2IPS1_ARAVE|nr:hypothetical protein AVEN_220428-1 [Araneus ventricosus]
MKKKEVDFQQISENDKEEILETSLLISFSQGQETLNYLKCGLKNLDEIINCKSATNMKYFILIVVLYFGILSKNGLSETLVSKEQLLHEKFDNLYKENYYQDNQELEDPLRSNEGEKCATDADCIYPLKCEYNLNAKGRVCERK